MRMRWLAAGGKGDAMMGGGFRMCDDVVVSGRREARYRRLSVDREIRSRDRSRRNWDPRTLLVVGLRRMEGGRKSELGVVLVGAWGAPVPFRRRYATVPLGPCACAQLLRGPGASALPLAAPGIRGHQCCAGGRRGSSLQPRDEIHDNPEMA